MSEEQDSVPPALGPADYARSCVNLVVRGQRVLRAPDHPLFALEAACFVTLKTRGELRGCVGTLVPAESDLGREIARITGLPSRDVLLHRPRNTHCTTMHALVLAGLLAEQKLPRKRLPPRLAWRFTPAGLAAARGLCPAAAPVSPGGWGRG
jgi:hypothetical protein